MSEGSKGRISTISMWSGGEYSEHTRGAKDVIDNSLDVALAGIDGMDVARAEGAFAIADLGAADGGTSIDLHRQVIAALRARAPRRPVTLTYTDLPRNDFSALFTLVHGRSGGIRSYLEDHDDVFVYASATSFFEPIFPPRSVDFTFSATAMHWLSRMPCAIGNHIHAVGAQGAELESLRAQARADWETILLRRADELKSGGCFVTTNLAIDERGHHMGNTGGVNMFDTMNALWRGLAEEGRITEQEYRGTNIPQFYRTLEEFRAPFEASSGPAHAAGLRLEVARIRRVRCPYAARFEADGDAQAFARSYVPTTRTWSETVFFNSLDPARPAEERQRIVDTLFERYTRRVAAEPDGHGMDYVHAYMLIRKA